MKLKRKIYETRREKATDFFAGFFGCYVVNAVIGSVVAPLFLGLSGPYSDAAGYILLALTLAVNAIAIVLLALSRTWIALGALAAHASAFLVVLAIAALIWVACSGSY